MKYYINNEEDLNEYEKKHKKISFKRLVERCFSDMVMCNNIQQYFYILDCDLISGNETTYTDENGNYLTLEEYEEREQQGDTVYENYSDIYQWFFVNLDTYEEFMQKFSDDSFILYYSNKLDCYILGVTHFGTGWDYVLTNIEYTTNWNEYWKQMEE